MVDGRAFVSRWFGGQILRPLTHCYLFTGSRVVGRIYAGLQSQADFGHLWAITIWDVVCERV